MAFLNKRLILTPFVISCSVALFSQTTFAGGGGGCSYISVPVVDWTATSGSITLACGNYIEPTSTTAAITVHSGATLDSLINNGNIGFASSGATPATFQGIVNDGTIGSIINNSTINTIINNASGTIGSGGVAINNGGLWALTNYGVINGNVVLQTGTTTALKIYGSTARIIGDVVISNASPTSSSELSIGDGIQTASFTSEGNFGATNYKLTSVSVGSGSTFNLNKSVYADTFANAGTLNLNTGAYISSNVTGAGTVNVNGSFDSAGTMSAGNFTIATTGLFNMNNDVTVSGGAFTNNGNLVLSGNRTVTGNYAQGAAGVIQIALDGLNYSKLTITGTASFTSGSTIIIKAGSDPVAGHTYNGVVSATSVSGLTTPVSGTFIENPSETYHYTITQNGSSLDMFVDTGPVPPVNSVDPSRANQANSLIQLAMITTQAVRDRLNWMTGASYQGTTGDNRIWMTPYTSWGMQKDSLGAYKQKISGLIIGGDKPVTDNFYVGGSLAIGGSALKGTDAIPHENFSAKNYQAIIYSKYSFSDSLHLKSYLMGGVNKSDLSRFDVTEGKDANASLTGYYAGGSVSLEKEFQVTEKQKLIPTIGLNYVSALVDKYHDSLNSTYDRQTAKSLVYSVGTMYQYSFDANDRLQLKYERGYDPLAKQGVLNSTNDDRKQFQLIGIVPGKHLENAGINYHRTLKANSFLDFDYHIMQSEGYKAEMVSASFHYMF